MAVMAVMAVHKSHINVHRYIDVLKIVKLCSKGLQEAKCEYVSMFVCEYVCLSVCLSVTEQVIELLTQLKMMKDLPSRKISLFLIYLANY